MSKMTFFQIFSPGKNHKFLYLVLFESPKDALFFDTKLTPVEFSVSGKIRKNQIFDPQNGLGFQTLNSHCGTTLRPFGLKLGVVIDHNKTSQSNGLRFPLRDLLQGENGGRRGFSTKNGKSVFFAYSPEAAEA